ncbi:MAG: phospholipase D family protein [Alphaproteobacteria bacterium]|nr:phospholipase D family protein [Alphaproteobacteria bacterium]
MFCSRSPSLLLVLLLFLLASFPALAERAHACFTPGEDCTGEIVTEIDQAQSRVLVQAYGFTSLPIVTALVNARNRGVDVRLILDKSQRKQKCICGGFSCVALIADAGIPVRIDTIKGIAHNKVMIIDEETVLTGSFNFTNAAQKRNAENVVIMRDDEIAADYAANWARREGRSVAYESQPCELPKRKQAF